jgi:two-component system sensor histidine kinase/response regulator
VSEPLILIIDDEETMRDSCSQILRKGSYRVESFPDGASGLRGIRDLRPDAVLVDLKMPGISGFEVLEDIQRFDPLIMAIVITGYATIDSAVDAMKKGAYDFLPKPFTPEELRMILSRALSHRRLALEAEALRREKRQLEDNVITMVSHQLRSPLVAIQQYFEVLLAEIEGRIDEKPKDMIRRARARLTVLLNLINDWLDLARIDEARLVGKLKPVDAGALLAKLVAFMAPLAKDHDSLECREADVPSLRVLGDEESLDQVFTNLLTNAIVYNRPRGRVEVTLREEADFGVIDVRDTGIGIAQEDIPLLFDQFYRVSRSEGKTAKGSGLGLSIAKKIVEAHHGRIEVASTPGIGSTFTIRLPKVPSENGRA